MEIEKLVDSGAEIKIYFHRCSDLRDAFKKIKAFKNLGKIEMVNGRHSRWLKIYGEGVDIVAFYGKKKSAK